MLERIKVLERDGEKVKEAEKKTSKLKEENQQLKDRIRDLEKIIEKKRLEAADQEARIKELLGKHEQYKSSQSTQGNEVKSLEEEVSKLRSQCEALNCKYFLSAMRLITAMISNNFS